MLTIIECQEKDTWDDYVIENNGHPLQLWGWGDVKQTHGWRVYRVFVINSDNERVGGAQILVRPLPWPFRSLSYIPRGPISHEIQSRDVLEALRRYVQTTLKSFT